MWTLAERASAQGEPQIGHEADDCWPEDQFPSLEAAIEPGEEILSAKVYFRSEQHPDFYYVEMHGNVEYVGAFGAKGITMDGNPTVRSTTDLDLTSIPTELTWRRDRYIECTVGSNPSVGC